MICNYCFHELGWKPSDYLNLPIKERLIIAGFMQIQAIQHKNLKKD